MTNLIKIHWDHPAITTIVLWNFMHSEAQCTVAVASVHFITKFIFDDGIKEPRSSQYSVLLRADMIIYILSYFVQKKTTEWRFVGPNLRQNLKLVLFLINKTVITKKYFGETLPTNSVHMPKPLRSWIAFNLLLLHPKKCCLGKLLYYLRHLHIDSATL